MEFGVLLELLAERAFAGECVGDHPEAVGGNQTQEANLIPAQQRGRVGIICQQHLATAELVVGDDSQPNSGQKSGDAKKARMGAEQRANAPVTQPLKAATRAAERIFVAREWAEAIC